MTLRRSATKSDAGHRSLPLILEAKQVLLQHRRASAGNVAPLDGWVFCRPDGRPLYHQLVDRRWNAMLKAADIEHMCGSFDSDETCSTSVRRFHVSRLTAATLLLEKGVALEVVSAILGHQHPDHLRHLRQGERRPEAPLPLRPTPRANRIRQTLAAGVDLKRLPPQPRQAAWACLAIGPVDSHPPHYMIRGHATMRAGQRGEQL